LALARVDADVVIVGGGLVGASLACALSGNGLRLVMVEPQPFHSESPPGYDDRTLALAEGSRRILDSLALWPAVADDATPIASIHISERGRYGFARLRAAEHGVRALGYVTPARSLGRVLAERLATLDDLRLYSDARVVGLETTETCVLLKIATDKRSHRIKASLVAATDGARSAVRELSGIGVREWRYGQSAIIANLTPELAHDNVAYERFTEDGPLALLPLSDNRCALVCTVRQRRVQSLMNASDARFLEFVQAQFGERLGRFARLGRREVYPLTYLRSLQHCSERVVLMGNAAHTLHPVAGQGFNLGLRDVAAFAEVVCDAHRQGVDAGERSVLESYRMWRDADQARTAGFTDGLVRLFTNPLAPFRIARNLGLLAFDAAPPLKELLAKNAMGLGGRQPKLARGLAL